MTHDIVPQTAVTPHQPAGSLILQGVEQIAPLNRQALARTGMYLSRLDPDEGIPSAHKIVTAIAADTELQVLADADDDSYQGLTIHIAKFARHGLTLEQIADRLALPTLALREGQVFLADIRAALRGGLAEGVARAAELLDRRRELGDTAALSLFLKAKAGWNPPSKAPLVQVNVGRPVAEVDLADIDAMKERQRLIIEEVDFLELD